MGLDRGPAPPSSRLAPHQRARAANGQPRVRGVTVHPALDGRPPVQRPRHLLPRPDGQRRRSIPSTGCPTTWHATLRQNPMIRPARTSPRASLPAPAQRHALKLRRHPSSTKRPWPTTAPSRSATWSVPLSDSRFPQGHRHALGRRRRLPHHPPRGLAKLKPVLEGGTVTFGQTTRPTAVRRPRHHPQAGPRTGHGQGHRVGRCSALASTARRPACPPPPALRPRRCSVQTLRGPSRCHQDPQPVCGE